MAQAQTTYYYSAMKPSGGKARGFRAATNRNELEEELRKRELLLLSARQLPFRLSGIEGDTSGKMPMKDHAALNEQLQTLLSRGVPLVEALEVAASVVSKNSKDRILKMRELVAAGASFAQACEGVGGFDVVATSVYRAAERSGDLAGASGRLATALRRQLSIRGKAITVMIYPAVVATISLGLVSAMMLVLVPQLADSMRSMMRDKPLPWFSELIFDLSLFLKGNLTGIALVLVGTAVFAMVFSKPILAQVGEMARKLPAVGSLMLAGELTRFFSTMAAMTRSGVPLAEALGTSSGSIADPKLKGQLDALRQSLVDGGLLRVLIERVDRLPLAVRKLLIAAERSGDLDQAFEGLSAQMADQVESSSERILAIMEPLVIVGLLAILGPIIVAIAIPMIQMRTST